MSIEMMKKVVIGSFAATALATAGSAMAQNVAGQWDELESNIGTGSYQSIPLGTTLSNVEFYGPTDLSTGSISANCHLSLVGDVTRQSDRVTIEVVSGQVISESGDSFLCGSISVGNFPWVAYDRGTTGSAGITDPESPFPDTADVEGEFRNIEVYLFGDTSSPICTGTIDAVFNNGSPITAKSYFDFDDNIVGTGSCAVDGTLVHADGSQDTTGPEDTNAY
jgi:hypothetical protein